MSPNKNPQIVNAGDIRMLVASINYQKLQSQDMITWKKKIYSEDEAKENPLRLLFAIEDNGSIHSFGKELFTNYKFTKDDIGKYIKFYSYSKEFKAMPQSTVFYVEEKHDTDIRIRGVERVDSDSKELYVGEKLKLKVNYSVAENKVPPKTKDNVKWMVKIEDREERLIIDGLVITGSEIEFLVPEEWTEKEVAFMPYLYKHTVDVSTQLKIKLTFVGDILWTETIGTGHTFISVHHRNQVYVYNYGRYDDVDFIQITGEGVLIRYTGDDAINYINNELYRLNAKAYKIKDVKEEKVIELFDKIWNSSTEKPDNTTNKKIQEFGRVVDGYNLATNNCTTISCEILRQAETSIFQKSGILNTTYNEDFTIPSSLANYLEENISNSNIEDVTSELKIYFSEKKDALKKGGSMGETSGRFGVGSGSSANSSSMEDVSSGSGSGSSNN